MNTIAAVIGYLILLIIAFIAGMIVCAKAYEEAWKQIKAKHPEKNTDKKLVTILIEMVKNDGKNNPLEEQLGK